MIARIAGFALVSLVACSAPDALGSARSSGYALELVDAAGNRLPTFQKGGRTYVLGSKGERYALHLRNNTAGRVEFVASVDGRDVLDGDPSALSKRGYIVNPYSDVVIDGFRLSSDSVAAFRFSNVRDSYAGRMGDARDVGVIGVGVFRELQRYAPPEPPMQTPAPLGRFEGTESQDQGYQGITKGGPAHGATADKFDTGGAASEERSAAADAPTGNIGNFAPPADPEAPAARGRLAQAEKAQQTKKSERPGLGTEFGEQRESHVYNTEFERATTDPAVVLNIRYDDRAGLLAMGIDLTNYGSRRVEAQLRETADPFRRDPGYSNPPAGWQGY